MIRTVTLDYDDALALARRALAASGAGPAMADVMAEALVEAESEGLAGVGLAHLVTYCEALRAGRIDGAAEPVVSRPAPALFRADAGGGVGHLAFRHCLDDLAAAARAYGVAVFSCTNAFTNAALGWFVARLADRGLVALAATNGGPALLAASGSTRSVFCTNPMAFAAPCAGRPPLLIDQSSSATAFVNIVLAAGRGEPIPEGWALDRDGAPTTDPAAAMTGVLLPFGGARGGNVALLVEVLAAGLAAANWSLDAPSFLEGDCSPGIGLYVQALDPDALAGAGFAGRLAAYLDRIEGGYGAYIPGAGRAAKAAAARHDGLVVPADLLARIREIAQA